MSIFSPLLRLNLKRRIAKGKKNLPDYQSALDVVMLSDLMVHYMVHAVGLGEVMAFGFILLLAKYSPESYFLVTSSTKASAQVFKENLPPELFINIFH